MLATSTVQHRRAGKLVVLFMDDSLYKNSDNGLIRTGFPVKSQGLRIAPKVPGPPGTSRYG
jgi:hypothetical protein